MSNKKQPSERDLTGSTLDLETCDFVGSCGDAEIDKKVLQLANEIVSGDKVCLLAEMMMTAVRAARGTTTNSNFKMMNRVVKEMRHANEVFAPYHHRRKVAVFGSARTSPEAPEYLATVDFSAQMKEHDYMTITGAGPGIMAAGNEGAGRADSFGLNISLPFEASANEFIDNDSKLINFNYFFTRKLSFVKEADAAVGFPGGVGTMDEVFEALTLIQTGKATVYPVILVDAPGGTYWKVWESFVRESLFGNGLISETDFALFTVTDNVQEAIDEILHFYKNFHSYRYVGDKLVIRMLQDLSDESIAKLNTDFADIIKSGEIKKTLALKEEENQPELKDLSRIVLRHKRRDFGRLRMLINAVNDLTNG